MWSTSRKNWETIISKIDQTTMYHRQRNLASELVNILAVHKTWCLLDIYFCSAWQLSLARKLSLRRERSSVTFHSFIILVSKSLLYSCIHSKYNLQIVLSFWSIHQFHKQVEDDCRATVYICSWRVWWLSTPPKIFLGSSINLQR